MGGQEGSGVAKGCIKIEERDDVKVMNGLHVGVVCMKGLSLLV